MDRTEYYKTIWPWPCTVKNVSEWCSSLAENPGMSLFKWLHFFWPEYFWIRGLYSSPPGILLPKGGFSRIRSGRFQGALKFQKYFRIRKSLWSDIPGFLAGDGDHSLIFLTVQRECGRQITRRRRRNCSWFSLRMAQRECITLDL